MSRAKELIKVVGNAVTEALSFRGVRGTAKSITAFGSNAITIALENGITVRLTGKGIPKWDGKVGVDITGIPTK